MVHQSNTAGKKPTLTQVDQKKLLAKANDMSETMFNTIGACFNQLQTPSTNIQGMIWFCMPGPKRIRKRGILKLSGPDNNIEFLKYFMNTEKLKYRDVTCLILKLLAW